MTVLKDQSGDPITDSAGTEIKANTTVVDALFGDGITRGTVPLDHGKGVNVLIDWFGPRDPSKPKSRGAEHLTVKFLPAGRRHTGADFESGAVHRAAGVNDAEEARRREQAGEDMGEPAGSGSPERQRRAAADGTPPHVSVHT